LTSSEKLFDVWVRLTAVLTSPANVWFDARYFELFQI